MIGNTVYAEIRTCRVRKRAQPTIRRQGMVAALLAESVQLLLVSTLGNRHWHSARMISPQLKMPTRAKCSLCCKVAFSLAARSSWLSSISRSASVLACTLCASQPTVILHMPFEMRYILLKVLCVFCMEIFLDRIALCVLVPEVRALTLSCLACTSQASMLLAFIASS